MADNQAREELLEEMSRFLLRTGTSWRKGKGYRLTIPQLLHAMRQMPADLMRRLIEQETHPHLKIDVPDGTQEILEAEIDRGPWDVLLVLADWHEENGDEQLGAAYRWLAENRKSPVWWPRGECYFWHCSATELGIGLPSRVNELIQKEFVATPRSGAWNEFPTLISAYQAAAEAISLWLQEGKPEPGGKSPSSKPIQITSIDDSGFGNYVD